MFLKVLTTTNAYQANLLLPVTTPSETAAMVLFEIYKILHDPSVPYVERHLLLAMARLWYAMAYLQDVPIGHREAVLNAPFMEFQSALLSFQTQKV
jgi:hypothetical protein